MKKGRYATKELTGGNLAVLIGNYKTRLNTAAEGILSNDMIRRIAGQKELGYGGGRLEWDVKEDRRIPIDKKQELLELIEKRGKEVHEQLRRRQNEFSSAKLRVW